jgi:hypothetical protein
VRGPLHGIPVAIKDNILTKEDLPTTGGMLAFKHYMAPYDATLVTHLKNAGAIILAKSTMSELAGWFGDSFRPGGYNGAAGQSYNPYDPRANDNGTPVLETSGSSSGESVGSTRTDEEGHYEIGLPPLGRYVLTALDPGTGVAESEDVVISAQRRRFNLVLADPSEPRRSADAG